MSQTCQLGGGQPPPPIANLGMPPNTLRVHISGLQHNGGVASDSQDLVGSLSGVADGPGLIDLPPALVGRGLTSVTSTLSADSILSSQLPLVSAQAIDLAALPSLHSAPAAASTTTLPSSHTVDSVFVLDPSAMWITVHWGNAEDTETKNV